MLRENAYSLFLTQLHCTQVVVRRCDTIDTMTHSRAIALYRNILRGHRSLAPSMRKLGDDYVKNEFRLHKSSTNETHLNQFYKAWNDYLRNLQARGHSLGKDLSDKERSNLSLEQREKLEQLRVEAKTRIPQ